MKRIITVLFAALFCLCAQTYAQNRADELMKQAQESLAKKEYIKARYLFLQAYNSFASQEKCTQAVECGVNASALYHRENYYKEAFELLRNAEQLIGNGEQKLILFLCLLDGAHFNGTPGLCLHYDVCLRYFSMGCEGFQSL